MFGRELGSRNQIFGWSLMDYVITDDDERCWTQSEKKTQPASDEIWGLT